MLRPVATIVALLMLATLPLQGVAAVMMLHCPLVHGRTGLGASPAPDFAPHVHRLGETAHHDAVAGSAAAPEQGSGGKAPASGDLICVSCATCCASGLLVDNAEAPGAPCAAGEQSYASAADRYSSPTPDRLERPPRFLLV